jgi:hypothetical protein
MSDFPAVNHELMRRAARVPGLKIVSAPMRSQGYTDNTEEFVDRVRD